MNWSLRNTVQLISIISLASIASTCGMQRDLMSYEGSPELSQIEIVSILASDKMEGREIGTRGGVAAAEFIKSKMQEVGLSPKGENQTYFQDFSFQPIKLSPHGSGDEVGLGQSKVVTIKGRNVVGEIDNNAKHTIVVGAHYDHLGYGNEFSLFKGDSAIHNGADDNASGVAAMLKLANSLKNGQHVYTKYNYVFMAFSGEEYGLIGSNHFCKNPTIELSNVSCMLNFDMVGRMKEDKSLAVYGTGTSPSWNDVINLSNSDNFRLIFEESGVGPSDHTSFYLMDIPVLHFFTGQHEDYHKPSDDVSRINFEGLKDVTEFVERIIISIQNEERLEFTKTKDSDPSEVSFKVTLGVVPDYMYAEEGMRIDGVTEERPASKAGMKKGDIVVQIGEFPVKDMMGYMECLGKYEAGDSTLVKVKRGSEILELQVTWD